MTRPKPNQMIAPPNDLRSKVGGAIPALDQNAVARAEAALARLSDQFSDWIAEELEKLVDAWTAYEASSGSDQAQSELHRRSHDLKGLAPTYGYPLVGRICSILCKLTGDEALESKPPLALLKAHVDAVKAAVRGKIMTADHPVGVALTQELEALMKKYVAKSAYDA